MLNTIEIIRGMKLKLRYDNYISLYINYVLLPLRSLFTSITSEYFHLLLQSLEKILIMIY